MLMSVDIKHLVKQGSRDKAVPALCAITGRLSGE